jgi:hypothetical protein
VPSALAQQDFIREVFGLSANDDPEPMLREGLSRLSWWNRSIRSIISLASFHLW